MFYRILVQETGKVLELSFGIMYGIRLTCVMVNKHHIQYKDIDERYFISYYYTTKRTNTVIYARCQKKFEYYNL